MYKNTLNAKDCWNDYIKPESKHLASIAYLMYLHLSCNEDCGKFHLCYLLLLLIKALKEILILWIKMAIC